MRERLSNIAAVLAAVEAGVFDDVGGYYAPRRREDGKVVFPSGATLAPDGTFRGPRSLYEQLAQIPADYRPEPLYRPLEYWQSCAFFQQDLPPVRGRNKVFRDHYILAVHPDGSVWRLLYDDSRGSGCSGRYYLDGFDVSSVERGDGFVVTPELEPVDAGRYCSLFASKECRP